MHSPNGLAFEDNHVLGPRHASGVILGRSGRINVADVRLHCDRQAICGAVKAVFDNLKSSSSERFEDDLMPPEGHHKKAWLSNRKIRIRAASGAHPSRISAANDARHIIIELGPGLN